MSTATGIRFTAVAASQPSAPQSGETPAVDEIDPVITATLAIYATRGWTRVDKLGRVVPDDDTAKNFVYALFRDHGVVNNESDIVEDGITASDLYAKTFPAAFGATSDPVDEVQYQAYKVVSRKIWQWAGTSVKSHCQETAAMEGLDYVMVEKKIFRPTRDVSTGTGAPKQETVRFFTSDPDLIFTLSSQPAAAKLVRAAEEVAKHLQMNTSRHPELTGRVAKETQSALKRSAAHLTPVTSVKAAALTAGSNDDD
jgi:hypothetical protein